MRQDECNVGMNAMQCLNAELDAMQPGMNVNLLEYNTEWGWALKP